MSTVSKNKLTITNTNHAVIAAMAGSHIADTSVNCSCCSLLLDGDVVGVVPFTDGMK